MEKKIECEIVQDLLLGYADNVLNVESKKIVEKHLYECEKCQKKLNEIRADIKQNEINQKKEIDYLKKVRRKSKIKSIFIALGIIFALCFIVYLNKFITVNRIMNKAKQSLQSNNFYRETRHDIGDNRVAVVKKYYKDGKVKEVSEIYSDEGAELQSIIYATVNSNTRLTISGNEKKATIEKGDIAKFLNKEELIKAIPFVQEVNDNLIMKAAVAFAMSITTDTYEMGREYYVIRNQFENTPRWETWIDKDTGLPLKEENKNGTVTYFPGTDIVKEVSDNTTIYKYEFGIVTDEDVEVPDISGYEMEYIEATLEIKN